jgi:CRISPR type III-A-associated protein Csm2
MKEKKYGKRGEQTKEFIQKLLNELKNKNLGDFSLKDLLTPDGYAERVVKEAKLTRVQLRKIYAEFKRLEDMKKRKEKDEVIKMEIYKLYPILQYQANRGLIDEDFKKLMFKILDGLESNLEGKNFEYTMEFMKALVAYTQRES